MTILTRAQLRPGIKGIDTTVKFAKAPWRTFAPTWPMVLDLKSGTLSEAGYTELYTQILDRVPVAVWDLLAEEDTHTILCLCRDSWFCHSHVLIEYAVAHWPERFQDGRPEKPATLF